MLEPMLFVNDVEAASRYYQTLLEARSGHGGRDYEMLVDSEKRLLLQLHRADADEHGGERLPAGAPLGAGVLLYFRVADIHAAYARAGALGARRENAPTFMPLAGHTEFVARDPDGYAVALYQRGNHQRD